jgi:hypothetical protein
MYPNTVLTAWQLALMITLPLVSLAVWLTAVFLATRQPSAHAKEASTVTRDDHKLVALPRHYWSGRAASA